MRLFCAYDLQVIVLISLLAQSYGQRFIVTIDIEFRQHARVSCSSYEDKAKRAQVLSPEKSHAGQRFYEFVVVMNDHTYSCCISRKDKDGKVQRASVEVYNKHIAQKCGPNQYSSDSYCMWKVKDDGVHPPGDLSPFPWNEKQSSCKTM